MQLSARNQLMGTVKKVDHGAVNSDGTNSDDAGFPNNAAHEEAVPTV